MRKIVQRVYMSSPLSWLRGRMRVCNLRLNSAYMFHSLTKFKMFYMHTDGAARNSIHCVYIFTDIFKNNDASQRVNFFHRLPVLLLRPLAPFPSPFDTSHHPSTHPQLPLASHRSPLMPFHRSLAFPYHPLMPPHHPIAPLYHPLTPFHHLLLLPHHLLMPPHFLLFLPIAHQCMHINPLTPPHIPLLPPHHT